MKRILLLGILVYLCSHGLSGAWLPPGWDYRKSHTINGSPVGLLTDYAVRIVVHYGSGTDSGQNVFLDNNCRTDFGDIRFTRSDGSTQLDFWIEEKFDNNYAVFWVEVNGIPASPGSATIYVYYGNNTASTTSNGKSTFDWFDEFVLDSSIDYDIGRHTTVWHGGGAYNPYYDPVNRRVAYDTTDDFSGGWKVRSFNLTIQNFAAKVTFGVTGAYPTNTTNGILGRWTGNSAYYGFYLAGGNYTSPALVRDARTTIIASPPGNSYHPFGGTPHTAELRIYGSNLTGIYNEGEADEVILNATDSTHSGAGNVEVIVGQATGWFDVFFVRKYVEPEPSHGSWGAEEEDSLTVITTAVSSITFNSASSGGNVTSDGGEPVTARGVCWSTSANPTTADTCTSDGTGTGAYTSSLTGLLPATTYFVRAYATNAEGTAYGSDLSFTTSATMPTVITTAVSSITLNSASSGGNVTSDGGATVTARGVCWSTSANPTTADTCTSDGTGTGAYTSSLTGLLPATTYYVRAFATNAEGTAYGENVTFGTLSSPIPTLSEWGIMLLMLSVLSAAIYYLRKQ